MHCDRLLSDRGVLAFPFVSRFRSILFGALLASAAFTPVNALAGNAHQGINAPSIDLSANAPERRILAQVGNGGNGGNGGKGNGGERGEAALHQADRPVIPGDHRHGFNRQLHGRQHRGNGYGG